MGSDKDTIEHVLSPLLSALNSTASSAQQHVVVKWSDRISESRPNSASPDGSDRRPRRSVSSPSESSTSDSKVCQQTSQRPSSGGTTPEEKNSSDASMFSMDYQSVSSESEMSIMMKNSTDSINERSETSLSSSEFFSSVECPQPQSKTSSCAPPSPPPVPFTPTDLTAMLKQNITPAELTQQSLEMLKSLELLKKTYSVVMKDSGAEVDPSMPGYLLDGETIVLLEKPGNVLTATGQISLV